MATKPTLIMAVNNAVRATVIPEQQQQEFRNLCNVVDSEGSPWETVDLPRDTRFIVTGWGTPQITADVLDRLPHLEVIFHAAGSVRFVTTPDAWKRGVQVVSAAVANNHFVAQYAAAQIALALKGVHRIAAHARAHRSYPDRAQHRGILGQRVGLVSYGSVARALREELRRLDVSVVAWDPYVDEDVFTADEVERVDSVAEVFSTCPVVSLHTPLIPGVTENLVDRELLSSMMPNATLLNTARGAVVDEGALISVLQERPDLFAILDVTWPEPPEPDSPLWTLPNVDLTGHIAGSTGSEHAALGTSTLAELRRYLAGEPLLHAVGDPDVTRSA